MQTGYYQPISKRARDLKLRRRNTKIDNAIYGSDFKEELVDTLVTPTGKVETSTQTDSGTNVSTQTGVFSSIPVSNYLSPIQIEPARMMLEIPSQAPLLIPTSVQSDYFPDRGTPISITPRYIQSLPTTPSSIFIPSSTATQIIPTGVKETMSNLLDRVEKEDIINETVDTTLKDMIQSIMDEMDKPNRDIISKTVIPKNMTSDMQTQLKSVEVKQPLIDEESKTEEQVPGEDFVISPEEERPLMNKVIDEYTKVINNDKQIQDLLTKLEQREIKPFSHDESVSRYKEAASLADDFLSELQHISKVYNERIEMLPEAMRKSEEFSKINVPKSKTITLYDINQKPTGLRVTLKYQAGKPSLSIDGKFSLNPTSQRRRAPLYELNKYDVLYSLAKAKEKLYSNEFDLNYEGNPSKRIGKITGFGIADTEKPVHWASNDGDIENAVSLPHFKQGTFVFNILGKSHKPVILKNPSDAFMIIVKDIVDKNTFTEAAYKKIKSAHEQKILNKFMSIANPLIPKGVKIDGVNIGDLQLLRKRYQILLGELMSGNQGHAVKSEMIKILQTLKKTRNMNPAKVDSLIEGLNEL